MTKEQELVLALAISYGPSVLSSFCQLKGEAASFDELLVEVLRRVPPNHKWFSMSWDQVMYLFLIRHGFIFTIAAHECLGRAKARHILEQVWTEYKGGVAGARTSSSSRISGGGYSTPQKMEKRLRQLASGLKGVVPPREVLMLYEGAPKRFLTKEDQEPEYLRGKPGEKTRLQKELEQLDDNDFEFTGVEGEGKKVEEEDDDDNFTFTLPPTLAAKVDDPTPSSAAPAPSPSQKPSQKPAGGLWGGGGWAGGGQGQRRGVLSPVISSDFSWNGAKVSPESSGAVLTPSSAAAKQRMLAGGQQLGEGEESVVASLKAGLDYVYESFKPQQKYTPAMSADFSSLRGRASFASQAFAQGGGAGGGVAAAAAAVGPGAARPPTAPGRGKVMGQVGSIAPSGLSWEDEIASQLAAAGVKVSARDVSEEEDDAAAASIVASHQAQAPGGFNFVRQQQQQQQHMQPRTSMFQRSNTFTQEFARTSKARESGLLRLARGLKKTFNLQTDSDKLIG